MRSDSEEVIEESRFVDAVARNLKTGRFLLLIVGDGIREEMERLAEFLQETPQLRFTLALVELQLYRLDSGRYLVMPVIVARTKEITRAVVRVASTEGTKVDISLEISDESGSDSSQKKRHTLTEDEFFQALDSSGASDEDATVARKMYDHFDADDRFQIDFGTASYSIKLRDPVETNHLYTVVVVQRNGRAYVGWLNEQLPRVGLPVAIGEQFVAESARLLGRTAGPLHQNSE